MTLEEFYEAIAGDLPGVRGRLLSDERIVKFVGIFMDDPTYATLIQKVEEKDYPEAFRAAHTMKGLCANLGFTELLDASSELTEALRADETGNPKAPQDVEALTAKVVEAYQRIENVASLIA